MAARLLSGRLSRDWWQRRPPKEESRRLLFKLDRAGWLLSNRWFHDFFNVLYERDPLLWAPGRSATRPRQLLFDPAVRAEALKALEGIRHHLAFVTKLVDEVITRGKEAQDTDTDAWLRRQLEGLGKDGA